MKIADIVIGSVYAVKVSERIQPVRITHTTTTKAYGTRSGVNRRMSKFLGRNENTGRQIGPFSAARCRYLLRPDTSVNGFPCWRRDRKETAS